MSECLRHSSGTSALGPFVAVASKRGLVAFEFARPGPAFLDAIRARIPQASLQQDDGGLAETIRSLRAVIDHPWIDAGLALDPRGSAYQKQVWALLCTIPPGRTTSYGALAATLGSRDARDVTEAIASNALAIMIPCHRVLKKDGSLSGYRWGARRKQALLDLEREAFLPRR